jgi:hypothetical protein
MEFMSIHKHNLKLSEVHFQKKKKKTAVRNLQSKLDPLPPQPGEQRGQKKNIKDNEEKKTAVRNLQSKLDPLPPS